MTVLQCVLEQLLDEPLLERKNDGVVPLVGCCEKERLPVGPWMIRIALRKPRLGKTIVDIVPRVVRVQLPTLVAAVIDVVEAVPNFDLYDNVALGRLPQQPLE